MDLDGSADPGGLDVGNMGLEVCGVSVDVGRAGPAGRRRCRSLANRGRQEAAPRRRPRCPGDDTLDTREHEAFACFEGK